MVRLSGWGRYPVAEAEVGLIRSPHDAVAALRSGPVTARGLGRSYGDSAVGAQVLDLTGLDLFSSFDPATGLVTCGAGVSLDQIVASFLPRGWFLPVTPGTRFVTVGGAIASDVHGKNHHVDGSFSDHVVEMEMLLGSGEIVRVSRHDHPRLFHATCGGMGLTGLILQATFRLRPVTSRNIEETLIKTPDLDGALEAFAVHAGATYSVGWIDLVAPGASLGRSLVMVGEHAQDHDLARSAGSRVAVPLDAPSFALNRATVAAFNALYYGRVRQSSTTHRVGYEPFFYPLDRIGGWNRLYGRRGFLQYQFVVPEADGREALREAVRMISDSGLASPLAVLKVFGAGNENLLSFPQPGYTLAVDFQATPQAFALCDRLDAVVRAAGGRLYLTKDSRMSARMFAQTYPRIEEFQQVRDEYGATGVFVSAQAERLGVA